MADDSKLEYISESILSFIPLFHRKLLTCIGTNAHCATTSNPKYRILGMLSCDNSLPTTEIAKRLYISKPQMTALIDRLMKDGLVKRVPDKSDRRVIHITITENGREHLKDAKKQMKSVISTNLKKLSSKDIDTVYSSLKNIISVIEKSDKIKTNS